MSSRKLLLILGFLVVLIALWTTTRLSSQSTPTLPTAMKVQANPTTHQHSKCKWHPQKSDGRFTLVAVGRLLPSGRPCWDWGTSLGVSATKSHSNKSSPRGILKSSPSTTMTVVVPTSSTTVPVQMALPPTTTVPSPAPANDITTELRAEWLRVATCEEGGTALAKEYGPWFYSGYTYPDSLGINRTNWFSLGGGSAVTETAQIEVARQITTPPPQETKNEGTCRPW